MIFSQQALNHLCFLAPVSPLLGNSDNMAAAAAPAAAVPAAAMGLNTYEVTIEMNFPTEFPDSKKDLTIVVKSGTSLDSYLQKTKKVVGKLAEDGSIYFQGNDQEKDGCFKFNHILMTTKNGAGIYSVKERNKPRKSGRASNMKKRSKDYEDIEDEDNAAIVICYWDRLPGTELDKINDSINECYSLLLEEHFDNDFDKWMKTASFESAKEMEKAMGGISIFFIIYMHQTLQKNGLNKLGVLKGLHLQHLESALQIFLGQTYGAKHEHLHCHSYLDWLIENVKIIDKDLLVFYEKIEKLTGKDLSDLIFDHLLDTCTWEPGYGFNSAETLTRKLTHVFKEDEIGDMKGVDIREALINAEESDKTEGLGDIFDETDDTKLNDIKTRKDLANLMFEKCGDFKAVTEAVYDLLFCEHNSKGDNELNSKWKNMYESLTDINALFNPASLGEKVKEDAKRNQKESVKRLIEKVDDCNTDGTVFWYRMVRFYPIALVICP
jgi:hypothetical protein